jgi:3'(2'), 5'-bisphosphate nucleotidase
MTRLPETTIVMDVLCDLALAAGREIMRVYAGDFAVHAKADASPVTEADRAADAVIVDGLGRLVPDIPIVTEERAASHALADPGAPFFLVDPLDGTREFIGRNGEFTVNIALIVDRHPRLGVVYAPACDRLFHTTSDRSAVETDAARSRIRPLGVGAADNGALRVVASKSHRDPATDAYIGRYKVAQIHSAGSSLKFCLVAAGEADLYPRLGRTMEWDTAAGHAVLAAAGGRVDRFGAGPLDYGKPGFENPHFIAYAPSVDLIAA